LLAKIKSRAADRSALLRVRGARNGRHRAEGRPNEFGVDRNGGDYRQFELPADSSGKSCAAACEAEEDCRAWTYVRPGYVGPSAVCYLKNRITRPLHKPCCVSGVVR
jgi:PAN domain.